MQLKPNLSSLSDNRHEDQLLASLKKRKGRATLGDVVVDTGLPRAEVETQLQRLLSLYQSHLEVDENGELLYEFDPSFKRRDTGDGRALYNLAKRGYGVFKAMFKATIMVVLVAYFILFVVLIIAAMFSGRSSNNSSSSSSSRSPMGGIWWFWGGGNNYRSRGRGYAAVSGRAHDSDEAASLPFYKKVFAYVFGPESIEEGGEERLDEKMLLAFIRANKGVITVADLIAHTGWTQRRADEELARILVAYQGDAQVTSQGVILYTFNRLAISAGKRAKMPPPAWKRLSKPKPLTGNTGGTNTIISLLNGFNLLASLTAPAWAPGLLMEYGIQTGPLIWLVLSIFPLIFSIVFFAIPMLRWLILQQTNTRIANENMRRLVLSEVFARATRRNKAQRAFQPTDIIRQVEQKWSEGSKPSTSDITRSFDAMVKDMDADVQTSASGATLYQFSELALQLEEARRYRELIDPSELRLGRIVFSSSEEFEDHGFEQFDEQLSAAAPSAMNAAQIQRFAPELGEFDDALKGSQKIEADGDIKAQLDDFERRLQETQTSEEVETEVVSEQQRK